jgi:hypothetical protein
MEKFIYNNKIEVLHIHIFWIDEIHDLCCAVVNRICARKPVFYMLDMWVNVKQ